MLQRKHRRERASLLVVTFAGQLVAGGFVAAKKSCIPNEMYQIDNFYHLLFSQTTAPRA